MTKCTTLFLAMMMMMACGGSPTATTGEDDSCTVTETDEGALVTCPDGSSALLADGAKGEDGTDGAEPLPCTVEDTEGGVTVTCPDGTSSFLPNGDDGATPEVTVEDEPPGDNCPFGGAAILVDGAVLDYVCNGRGFPECDVVNSDVSIRNDLELAAIAGCRVITGPLNIANVTDLSPLASLEEVGGGFNLNGTTVTSLRGLENLTTVGGTTVGIVNNPNLTDMSGFRPTSMPNMAFVSVVNNPQLSTCAVTAALNALPVDPSTHTNLGNGPC